jgi:anti-anti-sigma regulatory factor
MTFRIETAVRGTARVFILSGRIEAQALAELRRLFECQTDSRDIVLDLKDVGVVDRDVVCFFVRCQADGVKLENCAPYVREWMEREKD